MGPSLADKTSFAQSLWRLALYGHIKTAEHKSNGPLYINTVIGTLAVDGWAQLGQRCPKCALGGEVKIGGKPPSAK